MVNRGRRRVGASTPKWNSPIEVVRLTGSIYPGFEADLRMAGKRDKPEEIVTKFRQVEVLHGQGAREH